VTNQGVDLAWVRAIEERAFNARPALQSVMSKGWLFRFSNGYTKRANSANAVAPACPFPEVFREAELLYASRQLPLVFRISPLAETEADSHLDGLGFRRIDETLVMTVSLAQDSPADAQVMMHTSPEESWSVGFAEAHGIPAHHRRTHDSMLASIQPPAAYAMLVEGNRPIAFGLAVLEQDMIGLFDIVTAPEERRRGAGRRLTASLLAWGAARGASHAYLQVTVENDIARTLYEKLGFQEAYRYHYQVRA
jgi:GNAT superfamily N-acetyltransferase